MLTVTKINWIELSCTDQHSNAGLWYRGEISNYLEHKARKQAVSS